MKSFKIRKRRTKKGEKKQNFYFHEGTHKAIVDYQQNVDSKIRETLYVSEIMPAFEKLTENLINIHKFTSLHDSYDDLKNDCVNFLFETLKKFDPSRGTNPFSYFNVVAKHFLIIKAKQRAQASRKIISLNDPDQLTQSEYQLLEEYNTLPSQDVVLQRQNSMQNILMILYKIRSKIHTENENKCINAIITVFENIDELDLTNKNAIMLYIREISKLTPKQLTITIQSIKKIYKRMKPECDEFLF